MGTAAPLLGAALLPKCPFCFLALASGLEALGIAPDAYGRALLPILVVLLALPVVALGISRRGVARLRTLVLLTLGASLYLAARFQEWPLAIQATGGGLYLWGVFWRGRSAPCCAALAPSV